MFKKMETPLSEVEWNMVRAIREREGLRTNVAVQRTSWRLLAIVLEYASHSDIVLVNRNNPRDRVKLVVPGQEP